jgi:hypothetical protein
MQGSVPTLGGGITTVRFAREMREEEEKKKEKPEKREVYRVFKITKPEEYFLEEIGLKSHKLLGWKWNEKENVFSIDVVKDDKKYTLEIPGEILAKKLGYKGEVVDVDWDWGLKRGLPFMRKILFFTIREKAEGKLGKVL